MYKFGKTHSVVDCWHSDVSSQAERQLLLSGQFGDSDAAAVAVCRCDGASY